MDAKSCAKCNASFEGDDAWKPVGAPRSDPSRASPAASTSGAAAVIWVLIVPMVVALGPVAIGLLGIGLAELVEWFGHKPGPFIELMVWATILSLGSVPLGFGIAIVAGLALIVTRIAK